MMWAYSKDGTTVDRVSGRVRDLPSDRLDGGGRVLGLNSGSKPGLLADCGIFPVDESPRPSDPDWEWNATYTLEDGVAVQSWERGDSLSARNAARSQREAKRNAARQWARDARTITVNNGNNNAVTQGLVDRLADLIDAEFSE